jgi:hypothetical protein
MDKELLKYFLPEELLKHFTITKVEELGEVSSKRMYLQIDLEEKNILPTGYDESQYESKGFFPVKQIQDFPIRGKAVYLSIKRRRWRHKENKSEIIHNDFSQFPAGLKITKELSDFLKDTGRYPRIRNK